MTGSFPNLWHVHSIIRELLDRFKVQPYLIVDNNLPGFRHYGLRTLYPNSHTRGFMLGDDKKLILQGVYNTLYNATTRPDFKFAVSRYFIEEWVPLLGPSLAWLVVGLRQQCYWNHRRDWCIVDKATLAEEIALDKRTIERCLKKTYNAWFVVEVTQRYRYRHQIGKKVRDKNRYQLLLDDPLSPRHQVGLVNLLKQTAKTTSDPLETALITVQQLLNQPHLHDKISYTGQIPKNLQRQTVLELVEEAINLNLADYASDERAITLDQHCSQLYNQIVQPNKIYVGWQYFRLKWIRLLGPALAWLIIYLRHHCYWDEASGEMRDTFTAYKKDTAAAIGQTGRNLANLLENPHLPLFFTILNADGARNQPTTYQIRLVDEPLTPDDQQKVGQELRQQLQGEVYGLDPESGQLNLFPMFEQLPGRQNFAYGQAVEEMPPSEPKNRRVDEIGAEKMSQQDEGNMRKNAATTNKDSIRLIDFNEITEQLNAAVEQTNGLETLFNDLAIQEPMRSRLLANPNLTVANVGAWYLYAESQPGLFDPRGYLIKRLLANDPPPPEFLAFAKLDDATWQYFEEAVQCLQVGQPLKTNILPEQLQTFVKWAEIYGGLEPEETQRRLSVLAQVATLAIGEPLTPGSSLAMPDPVLTIARRNWQTTLDRLELQMAKETFYTWLKPTELLDYQAGVFIVDAKNSYAKDWLENRLVRSIERELSSVVGRAANIRFVVGADQPV